MTEISLLEKYPVDRLVPVDGMAVTAQVWGEAHDYHRAVQNVLSRYSVGQGILAGLDVMQSDPPDKSVYVAPGLALDHDGNVIVVTKPVSFEIGNTPDGVIHLVMSYGESRARLQDGASTDSPHYSRSEFVIEALAQLPEFAHVELARIDREGRSSAILAPRNLNHPEKNELDLRYRVELKSTNVSTLSVGLVDLGVSNQAIRVQGLDNLARYINRTNPALQITVDVVGTLDQALSKYDLLYITGEAKFELSNPQTTALHEFLKADGCVVYESSRQSSKVSDPKADKSFKDLAASLGIGLSKVIPASEVLATPNFFAQVPSGFEDQGEPNVEIADTGVLFSAEDYCSLWAGQRRNGPASRADIRTAFEWGENILAWVEATRK